MVSTSAPIYLPSLVPHSSVQPASRLRPHNDHVSIPYSYREMSSPLCSCILERLNSHALHLLDYFSSLQFRVPLILPISYILCYPTIPPLKPLTHTVEFSAPLIDYRSLLFSPSSFHALSFRALLVSPIGSRGVCTDAGWRRWVLEFGSNLCFLISRTLSISCVFCTTCYLNVCRVFLKSSHLLERRVAVG
jgi:hypothetical protein